MAYAARTGLELGADIVKIKYNGNPSDLKWAVKSAGRCKVVIAGGLKKQGKDFLDYTKGLISAGAIGLAVGRNVWQSENPIKLSEEIRKSLDNLKALKKDGLSQEVLFNIALSYGRPERVKETSANLIRDKELDNPDEVQKNLSKLMEALDKELNSHPKFLELKDKFDIETKKLFSEVENGDPALLGVSLVSVYLRKVDESQREIEGVMKSFWGNELSEFWPTLTHVKRIIGFNSLKFDVPVLAPYAPSDFSRLPHFDIMQVVRSKLGHSLSLATLAKYTLGRDKTDVGTNAVLYWNQHDEESLRKLKEYCEADVLLTKDLYDYGVINRELKYIDTWNNVSSFPVDFSYPKEVIDSTRQIGLF